MSSRLSRWGALLGTALTVAALVMGLDQTPKVQADEQLTFTGSTLSGASFNASSLRGKPVVLWFWTPWCPFCYADAPGVSQVAASSPKVTFVSIAGRADVGQMQNFVSKYTLNFTNLTDSDGSLWARFNVPWQPA